MSAARCGAPLEQGEYGTCDGDLYIEPGGSLATCRTCGTSFDPRFGSVIPNSNKNRTDGAA